MPADHGSPRSRGGGSTAPTPRKGTVLRTLSKKQKVTVAAVTLLGLSGTGGLAYAYWTTTGAGTGSAANAAGNGTITLSASWAAAALYPGGSQTVTFTATNAGATDLRVGTVSLDPTTPFTVDAGHAGCVLTDFSLPSVLQDVTVPAGATNQVLPNTGTLSFANDAVNSQDACKGATITAHLVSN